MHRLLQLCLAAALVAGAALPLLLPAPVVAQTATARYIPLQGQLADENGAPADDGVYSVQVVVYDAPTGGTMLWQDNFPGLPIIRGVFNVMLGSQAPLGPTAVPGKDLLQLLSEYGQLYVGLSLDGGVEMQPRLVLLPIPFAQEAGNSARFGGYAYGELFTQEGESAPPKAIRSEQADNADTLLGHTWADFFTTGEPETALAKNAELLDGRTLEEILFSPFIPAGTIWQQNGGLIDRVIDPRTLDSNNDGIPDRALPAGAQVTGVTNLTGGPVELAFTTWFVCEQNANRTLRFPDPETPGLLPAVAASYERVHPSLRGQLVPDRELVNSEVAGASYTWRRIDAAGQSYTPTRKAQSMAYDPDLDAYWVFEDHEGEQGGNVKIRLFWRSTSNEYRYSFRTISFPTQTPVIYREGDGLVVARDPVNNQRILIVGSTVSLNNYQTPLAFNISGGSTPADRESVFLTGPNGTFFPNDCQQCIPNHVDRYDYAFFFDRERNRYYQVMGSTADGNWANSWISWRLSNGQLLADQAAATGADAAENVRNSGGYYAFNPSTSLLYLFGSYSSQANYGTNLTSFTVPGNTFQGNRFSNIVPSPEGLGAGMFNPLNGKFLVYGGIRMNGFVFPNSNATVLSSLREYNPTTGLTTLEQIGDPANGGLLPGARYNVVTCFDSRRQKQMILGGTITGLYFNDLWELDFGGNVATQGSIIKVD